MSYSDMYYVQDTRSQVGNSVVWWGFRGQGYVVDIRKAGIYTREEALSICQNRETDKMWAVEQVNRLIQFHIDVQDLHPGRLETHTIRDWEFDKERLAVPKEFQKRIFKKTPKPRHNRRCCGCNKFFNREDPYKEYCFECELEGDMSGI